jgi:large subunit ribosomal protein L33
MAKDKYADKLIGLRCDVCKRRNFYTRKNKKTVERKMEFSKFCVWCRKHTEHKEVKITGK